ncbi:hypothetical protein D3C87_1040970 [compost metagenome]
MATALLLLVQVPPVVGDKVVVPLTHILLGPVIVACGQSLIVTAEVGTEVHPSVFAKTNVAFPGDIPLTTPALLTVAIAELLLVHVPPEVGESVVVPFTQITLVPVIRTAVFAFTLTAGLGKDAHPPVLVKVNVAVPGETPFTTPAFVTVATALLLLVHVPPELGDNVVVSFTHIVLAPKISVFAIALTVIGTVGSDGQPFKAVNVNVADP